MPAEQVQQVSETEHATVGAVGGTLGPCDEVAPIGAGKIGRAFHIWP